MQLEEKNTQASQATPPQAVMMQMANGHRLTQLIYIVAKLGIPDLLKDGLKVARRLLVQLERMQNRFIE